MKAGGWKMLDISTSNIPTGEFKRALIKRTKINEANKCRKVKRKEVRGEKRFTAIVII
jgi:hypothetical protein